jgi:hypothetical protein
MKFTYKLKRWQICHCSCSVRQLPDGIISDPWLFYPYLAPNGASQLSCCCEPQIAVQTFQRKEGGSGLPEPGGSGREKPMLQKTSDVKGNILKLVNTTLPKIE